MRAGNYFVYITTNPGRTVLYTGVTNDLGTRMQQHYENRGRRKTFAGRYYCYKLLYYQRFSDVKQAIAWEKEVKNMRRERKEALIKETKPPMALLAALIQQRFLRFAYSSLFHCYLVENLSQWNCYFLEGYSGRGKRLFLR